MAQVGAWRLRCKQCGDVLYDPAAPPPGLQQQRAPQQPQRPPQRSAPKQPQGRGPRKPPAQSPADRQRALEAKAESALRQLSPAPSFDSDPVEDSTFQQWLEGSGELKVLLSSDGSKAPRCDRHPTRKIVAACTRCSALLCKACLDRIDDEFACSECVERVALKMDDSGGVLSWFKKIFGGKG